MHIAVVSNSAIDSPIATPRRSRFTLGPLSNIVYLKKNLYWYFKWKKNLGKIMVGMLFLASVLLLGETVVGQYVPPQATVEPLTPRGLRISVPHEPGMTLVAFHVKFNEDFNGLEAGTIARDIVKVKNGRWTYEDRETRLKKGDTIYYWIHVIYERLGYNLLDQQHQVTEFYPADGGKPTTGPPKKDEVIVQPCAPTESKIVDVRTGARRDACNGQLLLDDQFDILNETLWTQIERFTGSPDYAFVVYRNDRRNLHVANGNLNVIPTLMSAEFGDDFIRHGTMNLERCTAEYGSRDCRREARGAYILPPVISGSTDTKSNFGFLYGKVEVRAKLPRGDWIYPIIVLEPLETTSSSSTSQLRVASSFGNTVLLGQGGNDLSGRVLSGGVFQFDTSAGRSTRMPTRYSQKLWSDDYHVYELEWRRDRILSRVDGIEYGSSVTGAPFDRPFYVKLGLAVGGHVEFPDSFTSDGYAKPWRNVGSKALFDFYNATQLWSATWTDDAKSLKVDYIRVWAL